MARLLTIRVGELFAEVCDSPNNARWFLPKKSLADGIKEKVTLADFDELQLQLFVRPDALPTDRFSENKVAAVVTSGFEGLFAQALEQRGLPAANEYIFGVGERIDSSGKSLKPIDLKECELISQKFKLMNISEVVIASINSDLNFDHQNQLASFFRDQGFKVFSSASKEAGELSRWTQLIEAVQWNHLIEDLEEQLTEIKKNASVNFVRLSELKDAATFYAGLDVFWLSAGDKPILLDAQPSDIVEPGFFDAPEFRHFPSNQRNGPLLLGKSMRPTALDLFLLDERTLEIDGLNTSQFDRMKSRIEEALVVMSKAQQGTSRIDGAKVANDTLNIFITALTAEIKNFNLKEKIRITGPLAPVVFKHLKQLDSNSNFELEANA